MKNRYLMQKPYDNDIIDIEDFFNGLLITSITGFAQKGSAKNIYVSDWIDSNIKDIYIPNNICYNAMDVTITYIVTDANADINVSDVNDRFLEYISGETIFYDMYRNKKNTLIFNGGDDISMCLLQRIKGQNRIMNTIKLIKKYSIDERVG